MKIKFFLISLILLFSKHAGTKIFNAEEFILDNGLKVVLVENKRAPVVSHMIWYNVGSVDEDYGKSGLAHFLEHLMFKGTNKYPGGFFQVLFQKMVEVKTHLPALIIQLIIK